MFGTDVGSWAQVTAQATWMEADLWVRELGMDPMAVIRGMTLDAARMMGADRDSGSIVEGKLADVIAVRAIRCDTSTRCASPGSSSSTDAATNSATRISVMPFVHDAIAR